jgi:hypothetical protein
MSEGRGICSLEAGNRQIAYILQEEGGRGKGGEEEDEEKELAFRKIYAYF